MNTFSKTMLFVAAAAVCGSSALATKRGLGSPKTSSKRRRIEKQFKDMTVREMRTNLIERCRALRLDDHRPIGSTGKMPKDIKALRTKAQLIALNDVVASLEANKLAPVLHADEKVSLSEVLKRRRLALAAQDDAQTDGKQDSAPVIIGQQLLPLPLLSQVATPILPREIFDTIAQTQKRQRQEEESLAKKKQRREDKDVVAPEVKPSEAPVVAEVQDSVSRGEEEVSRKISRFRKFIAKKVAEQRLLESTETVTIRTLRADNKQLQSEVTQVQGLLEKVNKENGEREAALKAAREQGTGNTEIIAKLEEQLAKKRKQADTLNNSLKDCLMLISQADKRAAAEVDAYKCTVQEQVQRNRAQDNAQLEQATQTIRDLQDVNVLLEMEKKIAEEDAEERVAALEKKLQALTDKPGCWERFWNVICCKRNKNKTS